MVKKLPTLYFGAAESPPLGMADFLDEADPSEYGADSLGVEIARELAVERGSDLLVLTGPDKPGVLAALASSVAGNGGTITASTQVSIGRRALIVATFDTPDGRPHGPHDIVLPLRGVAEDVGWSVWHAPLQRKIGEPVAGLPWRISAWVDDEATALELLADAGQLMEKHGVVASRVRSYPARHRGAGRWLVIIEYSLAFRDLAEDFHRALSELGSRHGVIAKDCSEPQVASYDQEFATPEPLQAERSALGVVVVPAHRRLLSSVTHLLAGLAAPGRSPANPIGEPSAVEMFSMTRLQRHHIVTFSMIVPERVDTRQWADDVTGRLERRVADVTSHYPGADGSSIEAYTALLTDTAQVPSRKPMGRPFYIEVRAPEIAGILASTARALKDEHGNIESLISKVKDRQGEITCEIQLRARFPIPSKPEVPTPDEQAEARRIHAAIATRLRKDLEGVGVSRDALDKVEVTDAKLGRSGDFMKRGDEHYMWAQPIGPFQTVS